MTELAEPTFIRLGRRIPAVLYRPRADSPRHRTAVLVMHSDADYLSFSAGKQLSERGYHVLCANVSESSGSINDKILDVGTAVAHLRELRDVDRVLLLGHSGGGTLMSAYQNLAENGPAVFQGPEKIVAAPDTLAGLPPADGLMLVDSNWGNGAMRLFSLDPAVVDERTGLVLDPDLDLFDPAIGFDPAGSRYDLEFVDRFQTAQGQRNNRTIDRALERLWRIESGTGNFIDDEPFVVPGAEQGFRNNRLFAQDVRFMSRTIRPHTVVGFDGSSSVKVVESLRGPENDVSYTASLRDGALITTVRTFLDSYAVRTTPDYGFDESAVRGVDWGSSYNCTTGNIRGISAPVVVLGMTAGWEFAAAEGIYDRATSQDKTLAYIDGADHMLRPMRGLSSVPGGWGDTQKHAYDYLDRWLRARESSAEVVSSTPSSASESKGDSSDARSDR